MQISVNAALEKLATTNSPFLELFKNHCISVEIYKPNKIDLQTPHEKDEVYIIISGTGEFINDGIQTTFKTGDFLYVPASIEHRFVNFTDDFSTWVIFIENKITVS